MRPNSVIFTPDSHCLKAGILPAILVMLVLMAAPIASVRASESDSEEAGISAQEAIETAERVFRANGWPWENISIDEKNGMYVIKTKESYRMSPSASIQIDKESGEIKSQSLGSGD